MHFYDDEHAQCYSYKSDQAKDLVRAVRASLQIRR